MNIYQKMKRSFLIIAVFILFVTANNVKAQAASDTSKINKQVNTLLKACKKYDINKIKSCAGGAKVLYTTDKKFAKYIKRGNKKYFSADVTKIKISGNKATVRLHVTGLIGWNIGMNAVSDYRDSLDRSAKSLNNKIISNYEYAIDSPNEDELSTYNIKLQYVKRGSKWFVVANKRLYELMDGGFCLLLQDFSNHPKKYL